MSVGLSERMDDPNEQNKSSIENELAQMHVAMPGIIEDFDPVRQTATVQPALMENIKIGADDPQATNFPVLSDVPVVYPRGGGYSVTFPLKKGDECLVVFADMCIDGWWQSGGVQSQMETRRHDLSDAFCIPGGTSQPRVIEGYSADTLQVRSDDGGTFIEIDGEDINMKAKTVTIDGDLEVTGETTISGIEFTPHVHGNVAEGGGKTAPPE